MNKTGNYAAFYVNEGTFNDKGLGAHQAKDFCYYNMLRAWKGKDPSFPFVDSHDKTYNVRDGSDWEKTLKPRLHARLRASKNMILFLSEHTKNSVAVREEITYAATIGLPIIVVYPNFSSRSSIYSGNQPKTVIKTLRSKLPSLAAAAEKVPVVHIPMNKDIIRNCLENKAYMINTKSGAGNFSCPHTATSM